MATVFPEIKNVTNNDIEEMNRKFVIQAI